MADELDMNATDGGKLVKMEVDYSSTCDEKIPAAEEMVKKGNLKEALDSMIALEKQTRTGSDMVSTSRVLVAIVKLCWEASDLAALNEHILLLSKRRGQLKHAVTKMVQEAAAYPDKVNDKDSKLKLIETLRTVTAGKIYVEVERARLTHKLALIKEADGDIKEAATILQELQVDTFGSMEKQEKVELILEQMRLCLDNKDYIRTQIIAKKINIKFFEDEKTQELKEKFYRLMIAVDQHEGSYLNVCKSYRALYATPGKKEAVALKNAVVYLVLAPYDNEQADLLHRVEEERALEDMVKYKELLQLFITPELIKWSGLCSMYEQELKHGSDGCPPTQVFSGPEGEKRWQVLKNRVVEHNIRIMAKYYTRISLKRMAQLLDLSESETEEFLSKLVVKHTVEAKTDRLEGIVSFMPQQDPNDILNEWSTRLNELMKLVSHTTHLIHKEEMVHKHLLAVKEG